MFHAEVTDLSEKRLAMLTRCVLLTLLLFCLTYVSFKYILSALLPLIAAALAARLIRPAVSFVSRKTKMPHKVCGVVVLLLAVFLLAYVGTLAGGKLIRELAELAKNTVADLEGEDNVIRRMLDAYRTLPDRIPFLSHLQTDPETYDKIYGFITSAIKWAAEKISLQAAGFGASFFTGLPGMVFASVVSVVALFYLIVDAQGLAGDLRELLPRGFYEKLSQLFRTASGAVGGYLKAYMILLLLTFGELFLGFVLLRVSYPFFTAALVALIDLLPVLGVGAVLIPWAVLLFIKGETVRAVGMLLLFGVMYAVRQFTEPKVVGHLIGLHPLITLAAAYLGFKFFGLWGMIAAPITLYVVKEAAGRGGNEK